MDITTIAVDLAKDVFWPKSFLAAPVLPVRAFRRTSRGPACTVEEPSDRSGNSGAQTVASHLAADSAILISGIGTAATLRATSSREALPGAR